MRPREIRPAAPASRTPKGLDGRRRNGHLYVTSERDNTKNTAPKDTILEFDPAASGSTLTPVHQWDMTSQFPQLNTGSKDDANLGFEGVGYVPDSWLTAGGWIDPLTHAYNPANYLLHGSGLYFAGLEWDGRCTSTA